MFNINGWEIIVIAVIFIALFGPERIPRIVVDGLRLFRQLREMAETATADITRELEAAARDLEDVKQSVTSLGEDVKKDMDSAVDSVNEATKIDGGENRIAPPREDTEPESVESEPKDGDA